ncbi:MAG: hypothetical protein M1607_03915, partial [Patescibacteria group bacterium]|nr:hypothetical protein [Patescibacteria group bacterium]
MLNPKLILILLVIIAIIAGFFLLQGKFSSFQSSQNSTSQKQSISNNGTLPSEQNSQPAEQGNSESSTVSSSGDGSMADVADDQMITECQRGKFAVGTQDLGGTVILGKEEHEINGQMVEVCCLA